MRSYADHCYAPTDEIGRLLSDLKRLAHDASIVFAPIRVPRRIGAVALASTVALFELGGFALIALAISSLTDGAPEIVERITGSEVSAIVLTVAAFSVFLIRGITTAIYQWWVLGLINQGEKTAVVEYVRTHLSRPYQQQLKAGSAEVLRTVRISIGRSYQLFAVGVVDLLAEIPAMAALTVVLFVLAPEASLAVALFVALAALVFQKTVGRRLAVLGREHEQENALDFKTLIQIVSGTRELLVRQVEGVFLGRLGQVRDRLALVQQRMSFLKSAARLYLEVLFVVGLGLVSLAVGLAQSGGVALSMVGIFAAAGFRALPSAARVLTGLANVQSGRAPLEHAADQMRQVVPPQSPDLSRSPGAYRVAEDVHADIQLQDIHFTYDSQDVAVLRGVSLDIPSGQALALVGRSGAGKTTLVDIMLGLLTPTQGTVRLGGTELDSSSIANWRSQVSLVPQDVFVLDDTVAENVRFGLSDANVGENVERSLRSAQLWDEVLRLADGPDTTLGSGGVAISGGQRQRLGIARALYSDPQVIFMDEATSSLDSVTELQLARSLDSLKRDGRTLVIVAHRLSTVRRCDRVAFLQDGQIIDVGTYDDLASRCIPFQETILAADAHGGLLD